MDRSKRNDETGIEHIIGYEFKDQKWLREALTHRSHASGCSYEKLEFLGDAVIQMIVSEYLVKQQPSWDEGQLTRSRAAMVSEAALSCRARSISLGEFLILGKCEEQTDGRNKDRILCDAIEALTGAICQDSGIDAAAKFVQEFVISAEPSCACDPKTELQKILGSRCYDLKYEILDAVGKDHERIYTAAAVLDGEIVGTGSARTKKNAERIAAAEVLKKMEDKVLS